MCGYFCYYNIIIQHTVGPGVQRPPTANNPELILRPVDLPPSDIDVDAEPHENNTNG